MSHTAGSIADGPSRVGLQILGRDGRNLDEINWTPDRAQYWEGYIAALHSHGLVGGDEHDRLSALCATLEGFFRKVAGTVPPRPARPTPPACEICRDGSAHVFYRLPHDGRLICGDCYGKGSAT
jgi:hypothetical protein